MSRVYPRLCTIRNQVAVQASTGVFGFGTEDEIVGSSYERRDFFYDCIIFITHGLSWVRALHALLEGGFLKKIIQRHFILLFHFFCPKFYLLVTSSCEPPGFSFVLGWFHCFNKLTLLMDPLF